MLEICKSVHSGIEVISQKQSELETPFLETSGDNFHA